MILKIKNENGVWIDIPSIQGAPGPAGKTPEKGTDYWTEEDQQSIVDNVLEELGDITASGDCVHRINNASSLTEEDIEVLTKIYNANAEYMTPILIGEAIITNVVMTGSTLLLFGFVCDKATGAAYVNHFYMWSWNKGATSMSRSKTSGMISGESVYISTLTNSASLSADDAFRHIKNNYALKSEIPSTDGLATEEYVNNAISNIPSSGGEGEKSTFFIDFSNATTASQDCPQEMIEFAEYMANNDAASLYITDGLNNETGYYYPAMWQTTSTKKQFSILKATFNLNSINSKTYFRIYQLKYSGDKWVYSYLLKDYDFQLITEKNISNFLSDYITTSQLDEAIGGITAPEPDLTDYYTKTEVDNLIPDVGEFQTQTQVQSLINTSLAAIGVAEEGAY